MPPPAGRRKRRLAAITAVFVAVVTMAQLASGQVTDVDAKTASTATSSSSTTERASTSAAAAAASSSAASSASAMLSQPDYSVYKTRHRVFAEIESIVAANPETMRLDVIEPPPVPRAAAAAAKTAGRQQPHHNDSSYSPPLRVVTVELGGLSPGPPGSAAEREAHANKYRLLLNYGEHGRELVTVESGLRLLQDLSELERGQQHRSRAADAADADAARSAAGGSERLRKLLRQAVFKIVPMENEEGRALVERGQLCERKNGRGVDPNRNWGVDWGTKEPDYDPSEEFPGLYPFSEPEARGMASLAASFAPHAWINVHSGMEAVFSPYDHVAETPKGTSAEATAALLAAVDAASCGGRCAKGSGGAAVGYLAHGTATDYMYDVFKVPIASTWEIYGDDDATFDDCFRMFNPVGDVVDPLRPSEKKPSLEQVAAAWADGALVVLEGLPSHPGVRLGPEARDAQANAARAAAAQFDGRFDGVGSGEEGVAFASTGRGDAGDETTNISRSTKASPSLPRPLGGHEVSSSSGGSSLSSSVSPSSSLSFRWVGAAAVALAACAFVAQRHRRQRQLMLQQKRREGANSSSSSHVGVVSVGGVISVGGGDRGGLGLLSKQQRQE